MTDPNFIESRLANYLSAGSDRVVKNNRYHYRLVFDESIGVDWAEAQVQKASEDTGTSLELYKVGPAEDTAGVFVLEVREIRRRADIDDNQHGLGDFSES